MLHFPGNDMAGFRIAVIEGDGIGKEVVPEGIRVVEAAAKGLRPRHFLGSARTGAAITTPATGRMMPEKGPGPHRRARRDLPRRHRLADRIGYGNRCGRC